MHVFNDDFIYRDVHGFEDLYQINELGEVYNKKTSKLCSQWKSHKGYRLTRIGKRDRFVHVILLESFTMRPSKDHIVDHINRVRDDNRLENLRWVTDAENQQNTNIRSKNTSGVKGVSLKKNANKSYWRGRIGLYGKVYEKYFSGTREGFELACQWRKEMEDKFYTVDKNVLFYKTNGDLYSEYFK